MKGTGNICWSEGKTENRDLYAKDNPDQKSHSQYDFIVGPFKTVEDAKKYIGAMGQEVACSEG